jgi:high-affinity iron transporter
MIFSFVRRLACVCLFALVFVVPRAAGADEGDPPEVEAHRLVHILDYVGADYGGAVDGGVVTNPDEFAEQLSLLTDGARIAAALAKTPTGGELPAALARVRALVEAKAPSDDVKAATGEVRGLAAVAFKLVEAPTQAPDRARGQALFGEHCATCHGAKGDADTERARTLTPRPANFTDPGIAAGMSPARVARTVRFGVNGTAMVPFAFLSDEDRWSVAFYAAGMRHGTPSSKAAPAYALSELAVRSDGALRADLLTAGVAEAEVDGALADLRRVAPYEDRAAKNPLSVARGKLDRAKLAVAQGDYDAARGLVTDAYLEGIEPGEGRISSIDGSLVPLLEQSFLELRGKLAAGAKPSEVNASIDVLLGHIGRAEALAFGEGEPTFWLTAGWSAGLLLREGVEAALLIAALLGMASRAGLHERRRWAHAGWLTALFFGVLTWLAATYLVDISGARREAVEGVTALLATAVLFYVSYSLLAKQQVARWMKFLREQVSPRRAALSLFGVSFLAAYREAFETVLFYQSLLASGASVSAVLAGVGLGAAGLLVLVLAFGRAGRFAPPQVFFRFSGVLLYALAVVFAGQGVAALQIVGFLPVHSIALPSVPLLGIHGTIETCVVQGLLIALAVYAALAGREATSAAPRETTAASDVR